MGSSAKIHKRTVSIGDLPLYNNDIETLKNKMSQLEQAAAMAQQYQQSQQEANPQPQQDNGSSSKDDNVVDADYTEKK